MYFDGAVSSADAAVPSYYAETVYINAVHVIGGYSGRVTIHTNVSVGTLELASADAKLDPSAAGRDLTVTSQFVWTAGTLNSTSYVSTVTVTGSGTTALIAPAGGGTVNLGSNFELSDGAIGTLGEGAVDFVNDGLTFSTSTGGSLRVAPGALKEALLGLARRARGLIGPGTSWVVENGTHKVGGDLNNAGTLTLMPETALYVFGSEASDVAYTQGGASSATYLHGRATLGTPPDKRVVIDNGTLATVYTPDFGAPGDGGLIVTETLEINNGHIYVNSGQAVHVNFGELVVAGNVWWKGGTFHPFVYSGGVANDRWWAINGGTFHIDGGTIAPIYLDTDHGTGSFPTRGDWWRVLRAGGGFTDATAPSVDDPLLWTMEIDDQGAPPIWWDLVAQ